MVFRIKGSFGMTVQGAILLLVDLSKESNNQDKIQALKIEIRVHCRMDWQL